MILRIKLFLMLTLLSAVSLAAYPVILFNASTGSDSQASGAGPATAIYGAAAAHTGGSASTTITLTGTPDLSGVAVDGSAVLWLKTASGRQFTKITAKNDTLDTVGVEDSFNIALASAVNWAIGGERAALDDADSRLLLAADAKPGWTISTETAQSLTSNLVLGVSGDNTVGPITLTGPNGRVTITQTANAAVLAPGAVNYWTIKNLVFVNTNGTKTSARGLLLANSMAYWVFENCVFGDATNKLLTAAERTGGAPNYFSFTNCEIRDCTSNGVSPIGDMNWWFRGCYIHGCGGVGLNLPIGNPVIEDCLITGNTGDGINQGRDSARLSLLRSTVHGNGGDGVEMTVKVFVMIQNCNITGNANYGIRATSGQSAYNFVFADYNNYGAGGLVNTSGALLNLTAGAHDLALDPGYANAAAGNFLVTAAGLLGVGFPGTGYIGAGQSLTKSYVDIGAAQRAHSLPTAGQVQSGVVFDDGYSTGTLTGASNVIIVED